MSPRCKVKFYLAHSFSPYFVVPVFTPRSLGTRTKGLSILTYKHLSRIKSCNIPSSLHNLNHLAAIYFVCLNKKFSNYYQSLFFQCHPSIVLAGCIQSLFCGLSTNLPIVSILLFNQFSMSPSIEFGSFLNRLFFPVPAMWHNLFVKIDRMRNNKNSYCCVVASEKIQKKKKHGSSNHVAAMAMAMASYFLACVQQQVRFLAGNTIEAHCGPIITASARAGNF